MFYFLKSCAKEQKPPVYVSKEGLNLAFSLNVPYRLNEHGVIWAKAQYHGFGKSFVKMTCIDCKISQKLKVFLNGQPKLDRTIWVLSDNLLNSNTVCLIAHDAEGRVYTFNFVKSDKGCDFDGVIEQ